MIRRVPVGLRIAVAATLAAAVALAVLTLAITFLVHRNLVGDIDARLITHLNQEQAEDSGGVEAPPSATTTAVTFDEPVLEWHTAANGQPGIADAGAASLTLPADVRTSSGFSDVTLAGTEFRVLTGPMPAGGTVTVGTSRESVESATRHLRDAEILLEPLLLLMVFGGALIFARRTLAPVERLRRTADAIDAEAGGRRFRPEPPHDELGRLAMTFDSMLDRLAVARRRQLQLTADASHELRTPLSVLKGEAALALRRPRSPAEYRAAIQRMGVEVERMEQALENLLWLARVQQGDAELPSVDSELSEAARRTVSRFAAMATSRGQRISADAPDSPVTVIAPEGWVERLLGLLVDNACKYSPEGGVIAVRVADAPPTLIVEDTGPGIPAADRERLLRRFERGDNAETAGSGLGLAIADAIVRRCGATWTIGEVAGGGCRISVVWPGDERSRVVQEAQATLPPDERYLAPPVA